jgi:hypothetical protein
MSVARRADANGSSSTSATDLEATDSGMMRSKGIVSSVIASKAKQSRLRGCGGGLVWIASLSLAMTAERGSINQQHALTTEALALAALSATA